MKKFIVLFSLSLFLACPLAQAQEETYKVLLSDSPSMVEEPMANVYEGFEIELWREIARRLDLKYEFTKAKDFNHLLDSISNNSADFALAGISVRHNRLSEMSFSHPYYSTYVRGLVREEKINVWASIKTLSSPLVLQTVAIYLAFCMLFGVVFWWLERKHENDIRHSIFPGIFDGVWYAFKKSWGVKSHGSRILVLPLWVISLLFSSLITAQVISNFDDDKADYLLNPSRDLSDATHAVVAGTNSTARQEQIEARFKDIIEVQDTENLYQIFAKGEVDSVSGDEPLIQEFYSRADQEKIPATIHPTKFSQEFYGIAISKNISGDLKQKIDETIMQLRDERFLLALEERWIDDYTSSPTQNIKVAKPAK